MARPVVASLTRACSRSTTHCLERTIFIHFQPFFIARGMRTSWRQRRAPAVQRTAIFAAAIAITTAIPATAQPIGETVTPQFAQAITNIPGKSLVAVVVDYAPGGASPSHVH